MSLHPMFAKDAVTGRIHLPMPLFSVERGGVILAREGVIPFIAREIRARVYMDAAYQSVQPDVMAAALSRAELVALADTPVYSSGNTYSDPARPRTVQAAIYALSADDAKAFGVEHTVDPVSTRKGVIAITVEAIGALSLAGAERSRIVEPREPLAHADLLASVAQCRRDGFGEPGASHSGGIVYAVWTFPTGTQRVDAAQAAERAAESVLDGFDSPAQSGFDAPVQPRPQARPQGQVRSRARGNI